MEKRRALGFAACALASSLWGCGFFFGKIALAEMSFAHMVLYRFLFRDSGAAAAAGDASSGVESEGVGLLAGGLVSWVCRCNF